MTLANPALGLTQHLNSPIPPDTSSVSHPHPRPPSPLAKFSFDTPFLPIQATLSQIHLTHEEFQKTQTEQIEALLTFCIKSLEGYESQKHALIELKKQLNEIFTSANSSSLQWIARKITRFILGSIPFLHLQDPIPKASNLEQTHKFITQVRRELAEILKECDDFTLQNLKEDCEVHQDASIFDLARIYRLLDTGSNSLMDYQLENVKKACAAYMDNGDFSKIEDILSITQNKQLSLDVSATLLVEVCKALCLTEDKRAISRAFSLAHTLPSSTEDGANHVKNHLAWALKEIYQIWVTLNPDSQTLSDIIVLTLSISNEGGGIQCRQEALEFICIVLAENGDEAKLEKAMRIALHPRFPQNGATLRKIIQILVRSGQLKNIKKAIELVRQSFHDQAQHKTTLPVTIDSFFNDDTEEKREESKCLRAICTALIRTGQPENIQQGLELAKEFQEYGILPITKTEYAAQLAKMGDLENALPILSQLQVMFRDETLYRVCLSYLKTQHFTTEEEVEQVFKKMKDVIHESPNHSHILNRLYIALLKSKNPLFIAYAIECFEIQSDTTLHSSLSTEDLEDDFSTLDKQKLEALVAQKLVATGRPNNVAKGIALARWKTLATLKVCATLGSTGNFEENLLIATSLSQDLHDDPFYMENDFYAYDHTHTPSPLQAMTIFYGSFILSRKNREDFQKALDILHSSDLIEEQKTVILGFVCLELAATGYDASINIAVNLALTLSEPEKINLLRGICQTLIERTSLQKTRNRALEIVKLFPSQQERHSLRLKILQNKWEV